MEQVSNIIAKTIIREINAMGKVLGKVLVPFDGREHSHVYRMGKGVETQTPPLGVNHMRRLGFLQCVAWFGR